MPQKSHKKLYNFDLHVNNIRIQIHVYGGMQMGRFTSGLIAGGAIGAIGLAVALSDKRTRKRMLKDGKRAINRMHM